MSYNRVKSTDTSVISSSSNMEQVLLPMPQNDNGEKLNLEMALERVGGFGLFQALVTLFITLLRNAGIPLIYMFAFLVMPQEYQCYDQESGTYRSCSADEVICPALAEGSPIDYRVDDQHAHYMVNW